ncbi:MAG: isoprenylcysteine carboxylmethyltransferase family protein [Candidatus Lokiarchaeota archaeon]|nr:isoprenylcysteine carboxylmethyltransferase family protein [Candidatus Lokiarchaeota archaeon]
MCIWFFISILGMCAIVPLHFFSVEHLKLQNKYGKEKGTKIGDALGMISGWGFFIFWFGVWLSPQPSFTIPILESLTLNILIINLSIPLLHLIICIPFFLIGVWFGVGGVKKTTLKVAETHRAEKVVSSGFYSVIRHPQYFGGILAHIGITFLFSSFFSLITTPIVIILNFLISWKEEKELIKEFGNEYEDYKKKVPMFIPKLRK